MGVAAAAAAWALRLPNAALLPGVLLATWGAARLPLSLGPRLLLAALACAVPPVLRAGALGPGAAALFALPTGLDSHLWLLLLPRVLLWQVEHDRLPAGQRGLLPYAGSLALLGAGAAPHPAPIPHGALLGSHPGAVRERSLRQGLGLLALGIAYLALQSWLAQTLLAPLVSGAPFVPPAGADPGERARLGLAALLWLPWRYLGIAGGLFALVGGLRLAGFELGSGFRRPFAATSFVEFWRGWNHYFRDAAMALFYYPALGALRHRLRPAPAQALAVLFSFAALTGLQYLAGPAAAYPAWAGRPTRFFWAPMARTCLEGALTAASAYLLLRRGPRAAPHGAERLLRTAGVLAAISALSLVSGLLARGRTPGEVASLVRFLAGW